MVKIGYQSFLQPIFFSMYPIMFLYSQNLDQLNFEDVLYPLILVLSTAISFLFLLNLKIKNIEKSCIMVSVSIFFFFIYGHVFELIDDFSIEGIDLGRHSFLLISSIIVIFIIFFAVIRTKRSLKKINSVIFYMGLTLILMTVVNIATYQFENSSIEVLEEKNSSEIFTTGDIKPDIYYIILDGYAGSESLEKHYNFNNNEFIDFLLEKKFHINKNSFSNYALTYLSTASSLNMEYINEKSKKIGEESKDRHVFYEMLKENKVSNIMKTNGYKIVNFDSGNEFVSDMIVDKQFCGNEFQSSQVTTILFKTSILRPIYTQFFEDKYRDKQICYFDELSNIYKIKEPVFVIAHVNLPHVPYIWGPNGEEILPKSLDIGEKELDCKQCYLDQLKFVNYKISETIIKILQNSDTDPIIIIQSDHGSEGLMNWKNPSKEAISERMNNVSFYYFPKDIDIVPHKGITPVNTFRIIFNELYNANYEILPDKVYFSTYDKPYKFLNMTHLLNQNQN